MYRELGQIRIDLQYLKETLRPRDLCSLKVELRNLKKNVIFMNIIFRPCEFVPYLLSWILSGKGHN